MAKVRTGSLIINKGFSLESEENIVLQSTRGCSYIRITANRGGTYSSAISFP